MQLPALIFRLGVVSAGALLALAACGGGGGGGTTPPPANLSSAPGQAAISAYVQSSHQYTLNAKDTSNNTYVLQLSYAPNAGTSTFNGTPNANSRTVSLTLSKNGVLVSNSISTSYFTLSPVTTLGGTYASGIPFFLAANQSALPTTLTVGASGPLDTLTYYHDSTQGAVDATAVQTFSVMANNSTTLIFCANTVVSNVTAQGTADGMANSTESDCYTGDASGNATLSYITLSVSGVTLTFK